MCTQGVCAGLWLDIRKTPMTKTIYLANPYGFSAQQKIILLPPLVTALEDLGLEVWPTAWDSATCSPTKGTRRGSGSRPQGPETQKGAAYIAVQGLLSSLCLPPP